MLMTKFGKAEKIGCSDFLFRIVRFQQFHNMNMIGVKLEDPRCFKARKGAKRHQRTDIEENQARSRSRKNRIVRFPILEDPVFTDKMEYE
jgi:hypothetical protein